MESVSFNSSYHYYMSNCPTRAGSRVVNTPSRFVIQRKAPLHFSDPDKFEVALVDIFIPGVHYNIYSPFNENVLEIRKAPQRWRNTFQPLSERDFKESILVQKVDLPEGVYTGNRFCDIVNNQVGKKVFEEGAADLRELLQNPIDRRNLSGQIINEGNEPADLAQNNEHLPGRRKRGIPAPGAVKSDVSIARRQGDRSELSEDVITPHEERHVHPSHERQTGAFQGEAVTTPTTNEESWVTTPIDGVKRARVCPTTYVPGELWDSGECGDPPVWWRDAKSKYIQGLQGISQPEEEKEQDTFFKKMSEEEINKRTNTESKSLLKVKPTGKRVRVTLPPGYFIICRNRRIQKLLGWCRFNEEMTTNGSGLYANKENLHFADEEIIYGNHSQLHFRSFLLPEPFDFNRNNRVIYIYSNLVRNTVCGTENLPLLKVINLDDKSFKTPVSHQNFPNPQFFDLSQSLFNDLSFRLANDLGEDFPFQRGENCILVLHFRKKKIKKSENRGQDLLDSGRCCLKA